MGKDEKPDIQNVMSAKEYADYLKRSAAFRRGIQETYAPGLKNYTRKDLLDDYKSLSMTPKDRMLAIPAETKRKWAQKRVTNNLALEKYFKDNNFSASDIKLFKESPLFQQYDTVSLFSLFSVYSENILYSFILSFNEFNKYVE